MSDEELIGACRALPARLRAMSADELIKAWALRELEGLPRGPAREWTRHGLPPPEVAHLLARLPEAVAALVFEHVADDLGECELCRRRAPCRLLSDGSDSGESDWRCAWGCPPPVDDPAETAALREWQGEAPL